MYEENTHTTTVTGEIDLTEYLKLDYEPEDLSTFRESVIHGVNASWAVIGSELGLSEVADFAIV